MKQIGHCSDCRYWDQKYPKNHRLGVCTVMGVFLWSIQDTDVDEIRDAAIVTKPYGQKPSSDVQDVRTQADFGCIEYEARRDDA